MTELQANHICKNINCTKGEDGKRAHYFACDYCGKTQNWRSMACSIECYAEYMQQVMEARKVGASFNIYPERTDMLHEEVVALVVNTPVEVVRGRTYEQLEDYSEVIQESGISAAVDMINADIKKRKKK